MDKWIKRKKCNDENRDNDDVHDQVNEPTPETSKYTPFSKKYVVPRKYNDDFFQFGFTSSMENDIVVPECVICGFKLSNSAMVPSKLQRHLVTNHPSLSTKEKSYFESYLSSKLKQGKNFKKQLCVSEKAQVASYEIAELIAVKLKPHNLAEEIILPVCRKIVKTMIGGSADIEISKIPLSNDTIHRRIKDLSENIEQNTAKTLANSNFAIQIDETTDITGNSQLIAFVRFIHENDIINQFLCCRELSDFTTALEERIVHYFPKLDIKKFDWVRNPFLITDISVFDLTLNEEEELILLSSNRDLILKHSEESINSFWINIRCEYPIIAKKALYILLQFSTSYLCEFRFSALANIKTKKRSRLLNVEDDMRVALSFLRPNINEIIKKHQAQISH
ncbi:protein FAM200B-like [Lycorma delicatula]|uniref:protein FAM200B-like n=1 Tax=Lycorma delicatula TaxID=130591 RepID=UPI003F515AD6